MFDDWRVNHLLTILSSGQNTRQSSNTGIPVLTNPEKMEQREFVDF